MASITCAAGTCTPICATPSICSPIIESSSESLVVAAAAKPEKSRMMDELDQSCCSEIDNILLQFEGKRVSAHAVDKYLETGLPLEARVLRHIVDNEDPDMPIMMVDVQRIISQWKRWECLVPRARPYYPVKCNDDPVLLRTLACLGSKFDCASPAEMRNILSLGCQPSDIIYSNLCKQVCSIQFARSRGITSTVFDNFDELYKLAEHFPEAQLLIRIKTEDADAQCPMSAKFGASPETWRDLLETAKGLGLMIHGVHFHVGSGCQSIGAFTAALHSAAEVFELGQELGFPMNLLDIGGGFPGDFDAHTLAASPPAGANHKAPTITFDDIAAEITPLMDKLFPPEVEIISEPGRYFATTSHTLAVKVFSRRVPANVARMEQIDKRAAVVGGEKGENKGDGGIGGRASSAVAVGGGELSGLDVGEDWKLHTPNPNILYYINDGLYGSFNCVLYDHATINAEILRARCGNPSVKLDDMQTKLFPSTIFGQTCDGFDCIIKSVELPKLEVGDWLVFRNMGAYTVAAASNFNGFSKPHTRYVRIMNE